MKFWDTSAIIPLCVDEPRTNEMLEILRSDNNMIVWWGTFIECYSAFCRLKREGILNEYEMDQLYSLLLTLADSWTEVLPSDNVKELALRILRIHPLRAADSLQLAAALIWVNMRPKDHSFVCLDKRPRDAAKKEGFVVIP